MIQFYFETPNIADWISVILTSIGLTLAFKAYNQWKREKQWDVLIEAKAKAGHYYSFLSFFYGPSTVMNKTFNLSKLDEAIKNNDKQAIHYHQGMQDNHEKFSNSLEEFKEVHEKLKSLGLNPNNIILKYYDQTSQLIHNGEEIAIKKSLFHTGNPPEHVVVPVNFSVEDYSQELKEQSDEAFSIYLGEIKNIWNLLQQVRSYKL